MANITLEYEALPELPEDPKKEVEFTPRHNRLFMDQRGLVELVENLVINPFEEALKERDLSEFRFGDLTIGRKESPKKSTSWGKAYDGLKEFLARQAKEAATKSEKFGGFGYCIEAESLKREIRTIVNRNTSTTYPVVLTWPKEGKEEPPIKKISFANVDYRDVNEANARTAQVARIFRKSVEREVIDRFRTIQKIWFRQRTGYDETNIPKLEDSPRKELREVGEGNYVVVTVVREDRTEYAKVISSMAEEIKGLIRGKRSGHYRVGRKGEETLVNITSVQKRLGTLAEEFQKPNVRYEIVP